jgi:hypothetical protein
VWFLRQRTFVGVDLPRPLALPTSSTASRERAVQAVVGLIPGSAHPSRRPLRPVCLCADPLRGASSVWAFDRVPGEARSGTGRTRRPGIRGHRPTRLDARTFQRRPDRGRHPALRLLPGTR